MTTLVWFREDLRLFDNPALHFAASWQKKPPPHQLFGTVFIHQRALSRALNLNKLFVKPIFICSPLTGNYLSSRVKCLINKACLIKCLHRFGVIALQF